MHNLSMSLCTVCTVEMDKAVSYRDKVQVPTDRVAKLQLATALKDMRQKITESSRQAEVNSPIQLQV